MPINSCKWISGVGVGDENENDHERLIPLTPIRVSSPGFCDSTVGDSIPVYDGDVKLEPIDFDESLLGDGDDYGEFIVTPAGHSDREDDATDLTKSSSTMQIRRLPTPKRTALEEKLLKDWGFDRKPELFVEIPFLSIPKTVKGKMELPIRPIDSKQLNPTILQNTLPTKGPKIKFTGPVPKKRASIPIDINHRFRGRSTKDKNKSKNSNTSEDEDDSDFRPLSEVCESESEDMRSDSDSDFPNELKPTLTHNRKR
jgi:hypothetical protein